MPELDALARYRLRVARSATKAAMALDYARSRLAELEAGAVPKYADDTIDARRAEIDGLTAALAEKDIVVCEDCKEILHTPASRARKVGPKCWAKRRAAGRA